MSREAPLTTKYLNESGKNSVRNIKTDVSMGEFGANLESAGYTKTVSSDGKSILYQKGDVKYSLRNNQTAKGTPGVSADYSNGTKKATLKIRLEE